MSDAMGQNFQQPKRAHSLLLSFFPSFFLPILPPSLPSFHPPRSTRVPRVAPRCQPRRPPCTRHPAQRPPSFKPPRVKAEISSALILDGDGSPDDSLIHLPPHKATSILLPTSPSPLSVRPSGISPSPTRGPDLQTPPWSWRWQAASDELCVLQNVFAVCICDDTWQASVRVVCFWGMFVYGWGGVYI